MSDQNAQTWTLTQRQLCDLELILNQGFAPLNGFMNQSDYNQVLDTMRLADGSVWPMPVTLDVSPEFADSVKIGGNITLTDQEGVPIASMAVDDKWQPSKTEEAIKVFGSDDQAHPAVHYLMQVAGDVYLGGRVEKINTPTHYDFTDLRLSPADCKKYFADNGWDNVVAFQTRNPMHRAHQALTEYAMDIHNAKLMIHPVVGMTKPGDVNHFTRVKCYQKLMPKYAQGSAILSLLPLAMRMGGPREALWHAIIRKNYGCNLFIVGRDHAGPGKNSHGEDFYGPYDAQKMVKQYEAEIGIKMVPFQELVYVVEKDKYVPVNELEKSDTPRKISGTEVRKCLVEGSDIPEWFSYPEVVKELRRMYPIKAKKGITLFFTGLSGAGKSTIANALMQRLMENDSRKITILDGDHVRKVLSSKLGFSREDRDLNILRIGYVASEITRHGGIAICAPIAPFESTRQKVREMVGEHGSFVEIHVATSLEECEKRDRKGLYKKARAGIIKQFTGINDPYEAPSNPEIRVITDEQSIAESLDYVIGELGRLGYCEKVTQKKDRNFMVSEIGG